LGGGSFHWSWVLGVCCCFVLIDGRFGLLGLNLV
jgi:hypothetical protein